MPEQTHENYQTEHTDGKLMGALKPDKADERTVLLTSFIDTSKSPPRTFDEELKKGVGPELRYKKPFEPFRGQQFGSCTISSTAEYFRRVERPAKFGRDLYVPDDIINQMYFGISGGQDTGLYETDALNYMVATGIRFGKWVYKLTGYAAIGNPVSGIWTLDELRMAMSMFHGAKIDIDVPNNLYHSQPDDKIDVLEGDQTVGGHSMYWNAYDEGGFMMVHTWNRKRQYVTNAFAQKYITELHTLIDAKDEKLSGIFDMKKFKKAVKEVQNTPKAI